MDNLLLIVFIALAMGCADTVVGPADAGTPTIDRSPTPDVLGDVAMSDTVQQDQSPDTDAPNDGFEGDDGEDVNLPDTAGLFTDAPFIGEGCNDLFPALPIMAVMHDEVGPRDYRGGELVDGVYRLVRADQYRPSSSRSLYIGQTIVVRGDTLQIASMGTASQDFSRAFIRRSTCLVNRPMRPDTNLCTYSCKSEVAGISAYFFHEMRGSQLILADVEDVYTFDRVAP